MTTPNAAAAGPTPELHEAEGVVAALESLVGYTTTTTAAAAEASPSGQGATIKTSDATHNALTPAQIATKHNKTWWSRFFPSEAAVDRLFAEEHMGNYVVVRSSAQRIFEAMPSYVRVGM